MLVSQLVGAVGQHFDPQLAQGLNLATTAAIITAILLVVSTGFGGWVAGRMAKTEYVLHGALVGGLGIIFMLIQALFSTPSPLIDILLQCVAVGVGALGGWLSQWVPTAQRQ